MVSCGAVSQSREDAKPPIPLEAVSGAILELLAQRDLAGLVARFLELARSWATPTAVLAAAEDPGSEAGWRLLPALCSGTGPLGTERVVARLVAETPECRKRPTLVKPAEETPGVRVRDNWIVPWSHEGESGVLVLRGVAPGGPPNLGDAILAASAPLWPRLLGSPAERVESLVKGLEGASARLQAETTRQLERLQQARQLPADARAELEAQLAAAREQAGTAAQAAEASKARAAELEPALRQAQEQREEARAEAERASARAEALAAEQKAAAARVDELQRAAGGAQSAEARLREAETQRDQARVEAERLSARVAEAAREAAAAAERADQAQKAGLVTQQALAALQQETAARAAAFAAVAPALRRAAFVSDALRGSLQQAFGAASAGDKAPAPWLSVVLLDRDVPPPLALAEALEAAGIRVRLAREPEELALLIRSPDAAELDVAVCDIATFRPDQNVAGLLRAWEKDKPGLEFYLTRSADPAEVERVRRVPQSLVEGHVQRPLQGAVLVEALQILARRLGKLR